MDRRRFLGLAAGGVVATLSGCAGTGGDGTTGGDGGTPTGTATTSTTGTTRTPTDTATTAATTTTATGDGETAEAIATAAEYLEGAGRAIARETDFAGGISGPSFDEGAVRDDLDAADEALDRAAGSEPTADQRETIGALRDFGDVLGATADALAAIEEGFRRFESAQGALEGERYDAAVDDIEAARDAFSSGRDRLATAREELSGIDGPDLPEAAGDPDQARTAVETFDDLLATMDPFLSGYAEFARGQSNLTAGFTAMEAEDYDAAATRFASARDRYERGRAGMQEAADLARGADLSELLTDLNRLVCLLGALRDGAGHMVDAAEAYADGDAAAGDAAAEDGATAFDRCGEETTTGEGTTTGSDAAVRAAAVVAGA